MQQQHRLQPELIEGQVRQFTSQHFLQFGKQLMICVARHMGVNLQPETDPQLELKGYDLDLDFSMEIEDIMREKICKKKKKDRKTESLQVRTTEQP